MSQPRVFRVTEHSRWAFWQGFELYYMPPGFNKQRQAYKVYRQPIKSIWGIQAPIWQLFEANGYHKAPNENVWTLYFQNGHWHLQSGSQNLVRRIEAGSLQQYLFRWKTLLFQPWLWFGVALASCIPVLLVGGSLLIERFWLSETAKLKNASIQFVYQNEYGSLVWRSTQLPYEQPQGLLIKQGQTNQWDWYTCQSCPGQAETELKKNEAKGESDGRDSRF